MTKVLFFQDAKLLLKVTLRFWGVGGGLHALEMCLVQGYIMTALDALPLWLSYGYTRTKKKKKKRTRRDHSGEGGSWEVK